MRTHWRGRIRFAAVFLSLLGLALPGAPASASASISASAPAQSAVRINEVESSGGSPGDWVELVNTGTVAVDLSGWIVKDNDDSHTYRISTGTSLAPGAFLALDVEASYGLGSSDAARLFLADGSTLVDSYTWTAHATTTYGRCPDGTGAFTTTTAPTKGAANACGTASGSAWPGGSAVTIADGSNVFGTNLSGLSFESAGVLWAVDNGPGRLYRLVPGGAAWGPDPSGGWASGKALRYANGSGDPDAEGVVATPDGLFVATERDNGNSSTSMPKILRFDTASSASTLNATGEWNLTPDLPTLPANAGPEGIAWIPDTFLTARGFRDEHTGAAYDPAAYPGHGSGLFFTGVEANGTVYAYALDLSGGGYTRVATFAGGFPAVMDLEFEPATGHLWAACDDSCQGRTSTLDINAQGRFAVTHTYDRPTGMPNYNNEGFAIAPQSTCAGGHKPVIWSDDTNDGGHALRAGTLNCTP
ncbi:lamin tail domain-containing protein [Streptomyces sp. NBC_00536]|uniref:lamin tail domain-containing protein n=1 Tax=Streptomyces sp. NBC_00536 TaxID=2975769 RepID=UPI002E80A3EE|nr:lamin tail domain-containing protein [Streptomyces sp. NBC_00536]WUC82948.1 lamin tail domain-containing protein [Streptomyces sp. NBC_00536]